MNECQNFEKLFRNWTGEIAVYVKNLCESKSFQCMVVSSKRRPNCVRRRSRFESEIAGDGFVVMSLHVVVVNILVRHKKKKLQTLTYLYFIS